MNYSQAFNQNIPISDILNQSDGDSARREQEIIQAIISACTAMQANKIYWDCREDDRNTYIRDLLRQAGYIIADQTLSGRSMSGINPGELDIMILETTNRPIAIYEALNLSNFISSAKKSLDEHLLKLLDNYNPIGLPFSFLVSYVSCSKDDFRDFWIDYKNHIPQSSIGKYQFQRVKEREDRTFYLRSAKCVYDREGSPTTVYHIVVRLGL